MRRAAKLVGRVQSSGLTVAREGFQTVSGSVRHDLPNRTPAVLNQFHSFHTAPPQAKGGNDSGHPSGHHVKDNKPAPKSGQTTGYGSSQVEADRTGGKAQGGGPKPTEHGTLPRPGVPSRDNPDEIKPRTGNAAGNSNPMTPGNLPPGYDENKPRPATATEQGATDKMQGKNQGVGHLGSDPTKDTEGSQPDYGKADPQKGEEELMQGGDRQAEKGRTGNMGKVDAGDTAGMPKDAKPPSSSPEEHHEGKREAKGAAGAADSWDPSSTTPSLDKGARINDPRKPREERSGLSPADGPPEGSPEPGSYEEELTQNVRVNETPENPQEMPPKVPSAI